MSIVIIVKFIGYFFAVEPGFIEGALPVRTTVIDRVEFALNVEDQDLDAMEAKGIDVIRYTDLTQAERKAWIEAARDFYPELEDLFGKDFLDLVVSKASTL